MSFITFWVLGVARTILLCVHSWIGAWKTESEDLSVLHDWCVPKNWSTYLPSMESGVPCSVPNAAHAQESRQ